MLHLFGPCEMLTKFLIWPLFDDEPPTFRHVSPLYLLMFRHSERSATLTSHLLSCQRDSLLSDRECSLDYFA